MITDYLIPLWGQPTKVNNQLRYTCPFCQDHKERLFINDDANSKRYGLWTCFNCGRSGNFTSLVAQIEGISYDEAKNKVLDIDTDYGLGLGYEDKELSPSENLYLMLVRERARKDDYIQDKPSHIIVKEPAPLPYGLHYFSNDEPSARPFIEYCVHRGISYESLLKNEAGYIIDGFARKQAGNPLHIQNHVIFFTYGLNGEYVYWNSRAIYNTKPKSFNAPELEGHYGKGDVIFNLDLMSSWKEVVLVEGVPDAITVAQGIATFGKKATDYQLFLLGTSLRENQMLYIMLDMDAHDTAVKVAKTIREYHKNTRIVFNPTNSDPNDLGHARTWRIIRKNNFPVTDAGLLDFALSLKV